MELGADCTIMNVYFQDDYVTLYHGDCRELLPGLNFADGFCFTDPPYNVGKKYGDWNDALPDAYYLRFCGEWIEGVRRCAQQLCVFVPNKYALNYWMLLGEDFKPVVLTWNAVNGKRAGWVAKHGILLTNATPLNNQTADWWPDTQNKGTGYFFKEQAWEHPGYTSEDLTGRVLSWLCAPERVVLDPFAGTGTTLVCAKQRGMKAVGCELSERWCEVAAKRLQQGVLALGG